MQESVMIYTTLIYKSTNLQFFKPIQEQILFKNKKKKMQEHDQENREKKETNTFGLVVIFESLFPKTARLTDHHVFSLSLFLFFSYFHAIIVKECSKEENVSFYNSLSLCSETHAPSGLCVCIAVVAPTLLLLGENGPSLFNGANYGSLTSHLLLFSFCLLYYSKLKVKK